MPKKLYYTLIMKLMNAIFCMFTHFTYEHMILYMNYTSIVTKGQKRVKKGPKRGKKKVKIKNSHRKPIYS